MRDSDTFSAYDGGQSKSKQHSTAQCLSPRGPSGDSFLSSLSLSTLSPISDSLNAALRKKELAINFDSISDDLLFTLSLASAEDKEEEEKEEDFLRKLLLVIMGPLLPHPVDILLQPRLLGVVQRQPAVDIAAEGVHLKTRGGGQSIPLLLLPFWRTVIIGTVIVGIIFF